jgi:proline iminopeptidase
MRGFFHPERYQVLLFDQRGCGRSLPHAGDDEADLAVNTTHHLIADIERLREHVGIERWLVLGMSWGATLALAYAERFPERVSEMILAPVTLTRRRDIDWFCRGVGAFFPAQWERFRNGVPGRDRDGDLVSAYARLLADRDPAVRDQAARDWCAWEEAVVSIETAGKPSRRYEDPRFRLAFARLVTHYWSHAAWLQDDELLDGASRLGGIRATLIHGRLDLGGPLRIAWELAQAWPGSELIVVEDAGHGTTRIYDRVIAATDRLVATA